ncbi:unnamed protein product [Larinioides sclopetarius]|uniref:Uncharacterized protein n=1 Tax=Larinioides sclopetarius TaxID=280406 RepID=A0AAV2ATX3_9ARAC
MYSPIPHNLNLYDDEFDFESNGFCPYQWEISVPQKNCIIWGVVLSYLRSADFTVPGKFEERLNRLSENAFDSELVKAAILDFNPFFNMHKCFFDETLQNINQSFRKFLNEKRPPKAPKTVPSDMQLISTLLKSNILIVDLSNKNLNLVKPSDGYSTDPAAITLFCREYSNKDAKKPIVMKRFTFSLNKDLCWELRRNAFNVILESSEVRSVAEKEIQSLTENKEKKVNILIALLKKNLTHVISELYESSYVVSKLADAGFETDPRVVDSEGFSALYYALQSGNNSLVYTLYRYAANNCYETESTFRDPNPSIISNLAKLKEIIQGDCSKSNDFERFGEKAEQVRVTYRDLLRFNEFLIQVSQSINEIREIPEDTSVKRAEKQKEIISIILENYDAFYSAEQIDSQSIDEEEPIENYKKHKAYYDNLDFTVALLFFDNIILLKSVLKSPRQHFYSDLECSFLLSAVTNKYFADNTVKGIKMPDLGYEMDSPIFSIIPLLERLNLRERAKNFCKILREKKLVEEDVDYCLPQQENNEKLRYIQELKDEYWISRLDHYMKTALEITPDDVKQKFVIQRALQVTGESISVKEEDSPSIRHLLRKCLPAHVLDALKKARNALSHLKSFQFPLKFETEKDDCLFASIQSEIRSIREASGKILDIQRFRFMEFLITRGLESVQRYESMEIHPLVQPIENLREKLRRNISQMESEILDQKELDGNFFVPNIEEFHRRLMGHPSKSVKKTILEEIPLEVRTRMEANHKLLDDLDRGVALDSDRFESLFLKNKDLNNIKEEYKGYLQEEEESTADPCRRSKRSSMVQRIQKSPNPLLTLDLIFEKRKVSDSQLRTLYEAIPFSDKTKSSLESLIEISQNPCGDNLSNLLNRVDYLYDISINERSDVRFLWERAKSSKAKQHLVDKIVQRYFREPPFQLAIEMLLFDCVEIVKNKEDFNRFWLKHSYLFNGIDLRNVLDFADPLVESIGNVLDPKDLPSELVKKMLHLFEDRECIETLRELWQKEKCSDHSAEWYKLKERIVCCPRWEQYCKLFAGDPKDSEICEAVISFLKNVTEPKRSKKY